jgi:amidase
VTDRDLCFVPASELLRLYKARKASPLEVMQAVFARIDAVNPALNAYVTLARESALAAARKATAALKRKTALPPLHGIPVSIKDLTPTKGIRTTWGSKIFADHVPEEDAITVERLKQAGAIVVGKTNTPEFGAGGNTFNAVFGPTRNPWNPALTCGGSSGGAAVALATGMGTARPGLGHGWLASHARRLLRRGRLPHEPRPRAPSSEGARLGRDQRDRAHGAHGHRHRADALGAGRARRPCPAVLRGRHARVHAGGEGAVGQGLAHRVDAGPRRPHPRRRRDRARRRKGRPASFARSARASRPAAPTSARSTTSSSAPEACRWSQASRSISPAGRTRCNEGLVWNIEQGLALTPEAIGRAETLRGLLWQRCARSWRPVIY